VVEKCEQMSADGRRYLPRVDREGNTLGDEDYMAPSPPERDKPLITHTHIIMDKVSFAAGERYNLPIHLNLW